MGSSQYWSNYRETLNSLVDMSTLPHLPVPIHAERYAQFKTLLAAKADIDRQAPEDVCLPPAPLHLASGQIWQLKPDLLLANERLFRHCTDVSLQAPLGSPCYAVITAVESGAVFGGERYRPVQICPLSSWLDLAQSDELFLRPGDTHVLPEPLLIESWNTFYTLRLALQTCLGEVPASTLQLLQQRLQVEQTPQDWLASCLDTSPQGKFQTQERKLMCYLQKPLDYLESLRHESEHHGLVITTTERMRGLAPPEIHPKPLLFPSLLPSERTGIERAAAAGTELPEGTQHLTPDTPIEAYKFLQDQRQDLYMDVWLEEKRLCFRFYLDNDDTWGQSPGIEHVEVFYEDISGEEVSQQSDSEGFVFLPLHHLAPQVEQLLALVYQENFCYFPLHLELFASN